MCDLGWWNFSLDVETSKKYPPAHSSPAARHRVSCTRPAQVSTIRGDVARINRDIRTFIRSSHCG